MLDQIEKQTLDDIEALFGEKKTWLTVGEFCRLTGFHHSTIRNLIRSGELPASQRRPGARILISYRTAIEYMNETA